ncbi:XisI protein [Tautonia plasticadhaerens]|uniref:XisI protein n=1 Tax=Tautonia plasticadhaerens TaxID=2527974 RepID=A0A518H169_9BACT|nr:XisI protein [Tautonia plasticadhaerens]QDV34584.1 XisI protein [Tautonia plasticadhaerens]
MEDLNRDREVIERVLSNLASPATERQPVASEVVFDRERDRYLLIHSGWDGYRRINEIVTQVDLIGGKIWIQRDGIEYGIAQDLLDAGIPKDRIVLGFKSPELRQHTGFAVA